MIELAEAFTKLEPRQQVEMTVRKLQMMLQNGQTTEAGELAKELGTRAAVIEAWCRYREKKFPECAEILGRTPESQGTLELQAYLHAYESTGMKDERKLSEIVAKLEPSNVNANNAIVIAAREKTSSLDANQILLRLTDWAENLDRQIAVVGEANLLHNMARLALEKLIPTKLLLLFVMR